MSHVRIVDDPIECRQLWECVMPAELVTDDWSFRACFEAQYRRPSCFIVAEDGVRICGLLPLSWIEEADCYGYFPGETWHGKTWLEQNRLICALLQDRTRDFVADHGVPRAAAGRRRVVPFRRSALHDLHDPGRPGR